jgi:hypothetical protein
MNSNCGITGHITVYPFDIKSKTANAVDIVNTIINYTHE